ncbi:uncharacterized protein EAF01_001509 [Botrytis porri]|uniref:Uncharacterized protein n=1 Tax=Botrytis porri TaxID=87229 RepID=A0A4Z1KE81_9HELO|nr:uncharacterized protein EAF01_001509 [Botrytis porri]KAF7912488.1 hypothetical protein EAF01_001509 [Botrytis porri]TGO84341.1 hypothetical protein BPOR_0517g00080 [Botrytis porri]
MARDEFIQRAKIIVAFPNIGVGALGEIKDQILPDTNVTFFRSSFYFNDPQSAEGLAERDLIAGPAPQPISWEKLREIRERVLKEMEQAMVEPGIIILDDNCKPRLNLIDAMEIEDWDYKLVSLARSQITRDLMPVHYGNPMKEQWLGALERLKDDWDEYDIPARKKFEIPPGQSLSDVIVQIMQEPIPIPRPANDPREYSEEDDDVAVGDNEPLRTGYNTDNRLGSNAQIRAMPLSFSNVIVNSPYSQNKSTNNAKRKTFFTWFFFLANVLLTVGLAYVLYNVALDYEEFIESDKPQKQEILKDPSEWVEESPFFIWTTWPKKLVRMALPYAAKRRQVSEELLDTVEKWIQTERFLRGSDPGWQFSDVLEKLRHVGFITSDTIKKEASGVISKVASTAASTLSAPTTVPTIDLIGEEYD